MSSVHIVVHGASGRMGARVCALAMETPGCVLRGAATRAGASSIGAPAVVARADAPTITSALELAGASVCIDFSTPEGSMRALEAALAARTALLVGTTGLDAGQVDRLRSAAARVPVLLAPNTSLGVAVMAHLAAAAARWLGRDFTASIVEAHHAKKKDAPSGTALRLARAVREAGGDLREDQVVAVRGGDVIGEHTVRFAGPGEYLEITHRATTRDLFARGAIKAACWLAGRGPGWYSMEDVLGLGPAAGSR